MKSKIKFGLLLGATMMMLSACDEHVHTFATDWSHDANEHWHAATCQHTDVTQDKAAHTWDNGQVKTAATCTENGEMTYTCTVCGATKEEPIPALEHSWASSWSNDETHHWHACQNEGCSEVHDKAEHSWDEGMQTREATCQTKGIVTYTCTVCNKTKNVETDFGNHDYVGVVTTPATCQSTGIKTFTCSVCGDHYTEVISVTDHDYAASWTTDDDYHWHVCKTEGCGEIDEATKGAHTWDNGTATKQASYTEDGIVTYTCTVCSKTKTVSVPKYEESVAPEVLEPEDYALETFGDPDNKVLSYASNIYDEKLSSYAWKFESKGNKEEYINFSSNLLEQGLYYFEFDYVVHEAKNGNFYVALWCNDSQGDCSEKQIDVSVKDSVQHVKYDVDLLKKTVTKSFVKVFTYNCSEGAEFNISIDNVKLTRREAPTREEPLFVDSTDGGTYELKKSSTLGVVSYNFVSNGTAAYEKVYLKSRETLPAGDYQLTFDYAFASFEANTMYLTIYEAENGTPVTEVQPFNSELNAKHTATIPFTLNANLDVIRIMTGGTAGVVDLSMANFNITKVYPEEATVNPTSLDVNDYALETFGKLDSKVLAYGDEDRAYDETLESYAYKFECNAQKQVYVNFTNNLLSKGTFSVEFDYVVNKMSGADFYIDVYCNDNDGDKVEKTVQPVADAVLNTEKHFSMEFSLNDKTVNKSFLKLFTWPQNEQEIDISIDNFKLTKLEGPKDPEQVRVDSVDGGVWETKRHGTLGTSFHFTTNGANTFEKIYFKSINSVTAGTYLVEFDYYFESFNANRMYITYWDDSAEVAGASSFNTTTGNKYHYSEEVTFTTGLSLIRIMTGEVAGVIDMYMNNFSFKAIKPEPIRVDSAPGGTYVDATNEVLGGNAYHFTSAGEAAYESLYFKARETVGPGSYTLSFNYLIDQLGTNTLYIKVFEKSNGTPVVDKGGFDLTLNQKNSFTTDLVLSNELDCIQIFGGNEAGVFSVYFKNFSLVQHGLLRTRGCEGGRASYEEHATLGNAIHFVANGEGSYEKIYLEPTQEIAAGTHTLTFDYILNEFTSNTIYVAVYLVGGACATEIQIPITLGTTNTATVEFSASASVDFIRVMDANQGAFDVYLSNFAIA